MKKRIFGRQLSRERDTRRALFRSLMRALIINGKIKTTKAKAKAIQGDIDKIITLAKKEDVASIRRLYGILGNDKNTTNFVVKNIAPVFSGRKSGFTRIINLPKRTGDNAQVVRLEWVEEVEIYVNESKKTKKDKDLSKKKGKTGGSKKEKEKEVKKSDKQTRKGKLKGLLKKKK